jgi:hypothetical protein
LNVEEDEAGRLAGFRARFGTGFDASKEGAPTTSKDSTESEPETRLGKVQEVDEYDEGFAEDDMNLLELISSYGQEQGGSQAQSKKGGK